MTTSGTTSDNEWQRVTTRDSEWYKEWQRVVQQVTMSNSKWQQVTANDNEWQRVIKSGTMSKNGTVYFKEWMIAAILSMAKIDILLQGMDGWY